MSNLPPIFVPMKDTDPLITSIERATSIRLAAIKGLTEAIQVVQELEAKLPSDDPMEQLLHEATLYSARQAKDALQRSYEEITRICYKMLNDAETL